MVWTPLFDIFHHKLYDYVACPWQIYMERSEFDHTVPTSFVFRVGRVIGLFKRVENGLVDVGEGLSHLFLEGWWYFFCFGTHASYFVSKECIVGLLYKYI